MRILGSVPGRAGLIAGVSLAGLVIGLLPPGPAVAAEPAAGGRLRFEHLRPEDGLSAATVYSLLQDRQGFLWIGTEGGLNRYDGYAFAPFRHDPDVAASLASDDISFMLEDGEGKLWLATWGGGLERFDPATESVQHFRADPERRDRLQDDRVQHLHEDSRGVLWIGTFSGGLSRLAGRAAGAAANGTFETYRHDPEDPSSLCHDRVWRMLEDPSGNLWVATGRGLCLFDPAAGTFERFRHRPEDPTSLSDDVVRTLYLDSQGTLWVGTAGGLNRFDRLTKAFERFQAAPGGISHDVITALFEDSRGNFWVGTRGGGLNLFDRAAGTWRHHRHDPEDPASLSDDDVRAILEDASGVLWVGTRQGGLNKLDLKPAKFETVSSRSDGGRRPGVAAGPGNDRIRALAEDASGRLWIATAEGLDRYDAATGRFDRFRHGGDPASLPSNDVHRLLIDRAGVLWIGAGSGLSRFDEGTGFAAYRLDDDGSDDGDKPVTTLLEDRAGNLWVGRIAGLDRLDRERRVVERLRHSNADPRSLSESFVTVVYEDSESVLWVGTHNGGVNRREGAGGGFEHFRNDPREPYSLSNNRVFAIHQQASGALWIGTASGLNQLRPDGTFRRYLEADGLPHPQIAAILDDSQGRLWIATGLGLARLDPRTGEIRNYTARDGLAGDQLNIGSFVRRSDGRLCFGGTKGLSCFDPQRMADNPHVPPVVLTGFKKFDDRVSFGRAAWAVDDIRLAHGDNFFSFEFAALDFTRPEDNRYRYQLEDFDRAWIDAGSSRSASYTNVSPGNYVFRVQGANSDGVWNRQGLRIAVSIAPPFWQRTWFRGLAVLAMLTAAGGAYTARVRHLKRREHRLSQRVEASLADLRRSEERYRLLFERNLAGVVRATAGGEILDCNDAFARILGYGSPAECRARHVLDFAASLGGQPSLADRLREDGTVVSYESSARTCDGSMVALLWNASQVRGDGGEPLVEGTVIDVSERRRIEEGLRRAQKLESLGVLAGGIAHDFNNLLMSIMGNAELARRDLDSESAVHPRLDRIETATQRAAELAKQMLAYSGKGDFVVTRLDLSSAVRELMQLLAGAVSKKARLAYELEQDLASIEADAGQVEQIVMSLVTNASEALGGSGGRVTIRTGSRYYSPDDLADTYLDDRLPAGRYVFLEVQDEGCGMDEDLQLRIFDPFFTTKFTGRGLGLAAVLGIIRGHRGAVKIDSAPGRGSTFTVLFPAAPPEPKRPAAPAAVERRPSASTSASRRSDRGTVLVVDDDESVRRVAQDMLAALGFDVLTAGDGQEGVEIFRRRAADIELVVLDLSMPRMSGEEAFREIREAAPEARVILASGYDEQESIRLFAGQGLSGFIQKPYRLTNLEAKVEEVLHGG